MIPENRRDCGLFLEMSIAENVNAASSGDIAGRWASPPAFIRRLADDSVRRFGIKTASREELVHDLSGGNQQKVVIAKWLATKPQVLLVDEPTRGIDVGAKSEIYAAAQLRDQGVAILMISSELPEILAMSDRILVMSRGRGGRPGGEPPHPRGRHPLRAVNRRAGPSPARPIEEGSSSRGEA